MRFQKIILYKKNRSGFRKSDKSERFFAFCVSLFCVLLGRLQSDILDTMLAEEKKLVILARFVPELDGIQELLKRKQIGYASVRGGVSNRAEEIRRFQEDADCCVFVGQIAAAGLGITLTAASTMVFYSLDYSMSNFEQAKARIHRVSQTENCLYIYLTAKHTVDTKILRALRDKADLAKMLVDDYRNGINPFQEGV